MCAFGLKTHLDVSVSDCTTGSSQLVDRCGQMLSMYGGSREPKIYFYVLVQDIQDLTSSLGLVVWVSVQFNETFLILLPYYRDKDLVLLKERNSGFSLVKLFHICPEQVILRSPPKSIKIMNFLTSCALKIIICANILCPNILQAQVVFGTQNVMRIICEPKIKTCEQTSKR